MTLKLLIDGRPLPAARDALTVEAGALLPGEAYVTPHLDDAAQLRATAAELREMALRVGAADAVPPPRRRLVLYRDALHALQEKGWLPDVSVEAGREIAKLREAVTRCASGPAMCRYGAPTMAGGGDMLPPTLHEAYLTRYQPWADWARHQVIAPKAGHTLLDLTLLVCVDGLGQRQAADRLRMNQRRLLRLLQDSLWWYVENAGWVPAAQYA